MPSPWRRKQSLENQHFLTAITHRANPVMECLAALSVQARGHRGPGLHTGLLSGRVNTLGPALNKCHSQWGRSRPSPPARLDADNPSQKPCWSDPAVACGSGVGKWGRSGIVPAVVQITIQVTQVFFGHVHINTDTFEKGYLCIKDFLSAQAFSGQFGKVLHPH